MPGFSFQIENYTVNRIQSDAPLCVFTISSIKYTHNIVHDAKIYLSPQFTQFHGYVGNLNALNFDGISIRAFAKADDFGFYHKLLQTEAPIFFQVSYEDIARDKKYAKLRNFGFATENEPLGEGMLDSDVISLVQSGKLEELVGRV